MWLSTNFCIPWERNTNKIGPIATILFKSFGSVQKKPFKKLLLNHLNEIFMNLFFRNNIDPASYSAYSIIQNDDWFDINSRYHSLGIKNWNRGIKIKLNLKVRSSIRYALFCNNIPLRWCLWYKYPSMVSKQNIIFN